MSSQAQYATARSIFLAFQAPWADAAWVNGRLSVVAEMPQIIKKWPNHSMRVDKVVWPV